MTIFEHGFDPLASRMDMKAWMYCTWIAVVGCGSGGALSIGANDAGGPAANGPNDGGADGAINGEPPLTVRCDPGPMPQGKTLCGRTWQTPIKLADHHPGEIHVAGRDGNFVALVDGNASLASRYADGIGWTKPTSFNDGRPGLFWHFGAGGTDVMALWYETSGSDEKIWTARSSGGTWSRPTEHGITEPTYGLSLAVAPNGAAIQGFFTPTFGKASITTFDPTSGWGQTASIDAVPPLAVAIDSAGNAAALWVKQPQSSFDQLPYVARRPAGGTWEPEVPLNTAASPVTARDLNLAAYAGGRLVAVWTELNSGAIASRRFDPQSGWSAPQILQPSGLKSPTLRVHIDENGFGYAFWNRQDGAVHAKFDATSGFGTPAAFPGTLAAIDIAGGHAIAAWHKDNAIMATCSTDDGWAPPVTISDVTSVVGSPPIVSTAISTSGTAAVMWTGTQGTCVSNLR